MLLSAVSVLVVAQSIFEIPEGLMNNPVYVGDHGGTVVKVLCYKSEGRWFDPSWCHWNISLT